MVVYACRARWRYVETREESDDTNGVSERVNDTFSDEGMISAIQVRLVIGSQTTLGKRTSRILFVNAQKKSTLGTLSNKCLFAQQLSMHAVCS